MEKTFEQKIKTLMEMHHYIRGDVHFCGYNEEDVTNALESAISTMCKYEKIEQIIDHWINEDLVGMSDYWMGKIKEVLEDGKTDFERI